MTHSGITLTADWRGVFYIALIIVATFCISILGGMAFGYSLRDEQIKKQVDEL